MEVTKCKYSGECNYKKCGRVCGHNIACIHQDEQKNTKNIRVGPCHDGMWYSVDNDQYST